MSSLLALGRCAVLGILNVTPDSFSDGGRYLDHDHAVAHGVAMRDAGADLVDVGGESTRPGAGRVDPATERDRVLPVVRDLVAAGVRVSVDTTRSEVAAAGVEAGAVVVNDVSGGLEDPRMAAVVAEARVPWILMHWRGPSDRMQQLAEYEDVIGEVRQELVARADHAVMAGVDPDQIVLDPGLGFAKTASHNWALLRRLDVLVALGFPVLVGASRKRFLGDLLADADGTPAAAVRPGRGDGRGERARRGGRCVGCPRARRRVHDGRRRGEHGVPARRVPRPDRSLARGPAVMHADATGSSCAGCACAATTACSTTSAATGRTSSSTSSCRPTCPRPPRPTTSPTRSTTARWRSGRRRSSAAGRTT